MSHVRSLSQQLEAAATAQPTPGGSQQVQEVLVGAVNPPLTDDNISMISGTSTVSNFAGGERRIDVYLRDTRVIIDAEMRAWKTKIQVFAGRKQEEIEALENEEAVTAAEDCDQLVRAIGKQLKVWILHACDNLTTTDPVDKEIRYRIAKYVDRKRAIFEKYGFVMDKDARGNLEWQQTCIWPSENFILTHAREPEKRNIGDITIASSGEAQEEKRCNVETDLTAPAPTTGQDDLQLGAEASGLQLVIPPNLRGRSRSPADQQRARLEALASQINKERGA